MRHYPILNSSHGEHREVRCPVCYREAVHWEMAGSFGLECVECGYSAAFKEPTAGKRAE